MTDGTTYNLAGGDVCLFHADMREALKALPDNCVDSCVTDPPYHLTSVVKRFGGPNAAPAQFGTDGVFERSSRGFMSKTWDGGDIAFRVETWAEVLRVLKPGGHVAAMGGTRTYHHLAMAIELAGFEVRDSLSWIYATGFPKSQDVGKFIDKLDATDARRERQLRFTAWMRLTGMTAARINDLTGTRMGSHYLTDKEQPAVAVRELFELMRPHFDSDVPEWVETLVNERTVESENFKRREVTGQREKLESWKYEGNNVYQTGGDQHHVTLDITASATPEAQQWEGWGTALKPAHEPIVLARKPLSESTVAANVLRWRCGALNIGACRVAAPGELIETTGETVTTACHEGYQRPGASMFNTGKPKERAGPANEAGRWPPNLLTDGSAEVVEAFPISAGQLARARTDGGPQNNAIYGPMRHGTINPEPRGDSGSAARFFTSCPPDSVSRFHYSSKANKADRAGSKHPTIKPVSLMSWLARLITPPGGVVLDPFAGSGTTGQAALQNGFKAILCEREAEYVADIIRRLSPSSPPLVPSQSSGG